MIRANRRSLETWVYGLCTLDGHLAPILPQRATIPLSNSPGVWATNVTVEPRVIRVGLDVRPVSLADRQTIMDRFARELAGLLEIETDDLPGRMCTARLDRVDVELYPASFVQKACWVDLTFVAQDPTRWEVEPRLYGLSTTARTPCPVGTQTSAPVMEIVGSCTNPAIILRNARGEEVARTQFTVTLGSNDVLTVDSATEQITRLVSGVVQTGASAGLAAYTSGPLPLLAPEDASADGTLSPTVELAASSGTPVGTISYRRRW